MTESAFLYKRLVDEFETKIRQGDLCTGDKLPSLRGLQRKLGLSLGTVYQAYTELEALGLVEARPKSGYFVTGARRLSMPTPAYPRRIAEPSLVQDTSIIGAVVNSSRDPNLVPFGASTLSLDLYPHKHLNRIIKSISAQRMKDLLQYAAPGGDSELKRLVAARLLGMLPDVTPDQIVITSGCLEAVTLALRAVTAPGEMVAVESPTFFGSLQFLQMSGLYVAEVPTDPRYGVDLAAFRKVLDRYPIKACLFTPNFQNPLGALMPEENKRELMGWLNERNIPVIEDDIYAELHYGSKRPSLLAALDRKGLAVTCSSLTKVLAPGFRIGWAVARGGLRDRIASLKSGGSIASGSLEQYVAARFLGSGAFDRYLRSLRRTVRAMVLETALAVQAHFPPGCRLAPPEGGNVLWVELPRNVNGMDLYKRARERGISIVPGSAFSNTRNFDHYIRLSCTRPCDDRLKQGLRILGGLVADLAGAQGSR